MTIITLKPYFAIILAAIELAPYPPIEKPGDGVGVGSATGGGVDGVSTVNEGGGAIAAPAERFEISSASSSSGC
jgi:hypothetical protein